MKQLGWNGASHWYYKEMEDDADVVWAAITENVRAAPFGVLMAAVPIHTNKTAQALDLDISFSNKTYQDWKCYDNKIG